MAERISKYEWVTEAIRAKILPGTYPNGSRLPSIQKLADEYFSSPVTIRKALSKLAQEGLVSLHRGQEAVVIYDGLACAQGDTYAAWLAASRDAIDDAYWLVQEVLSPALLFGAKTCAPLDIDDLRLACAEAAEKPNSVQDQLYLLRQIFTCLTRNLNSFILNAMYERIHEFIFMPLLLATEKGLPIGDAGIPAVGRKIASCASAGNASGAARLYRELSRTLAQMSKQFSKKICASVTVTQKNRFTWLPHRNDSYMYRSIMSDLLIKIEGGEYPHGELLPSESMLCQLYGTSVITIRKAIDQLNKSSITRTINGKGTEVLLYAGHLPKYNQSSYPHTRYIAAFYACNIQLWALSIPALVSASIHQVSELDALRLKQRVMYMLDDEKERHYCTSRFFLHFLIMNTPCDALKSAVYPLLVRVACSLTRMMVHEFSQDPALFDRYANHMRSAAGHLDERNAAGLISDLSAMAGISMTVLKAHADKNNLPFSFHTPDEATLLSLTEFLSEAE